MQIGNYSYEQFAELTTSFHGSVAPGVLVGGIMVQEAVKRLPEGILYDVISETRHCLPDAVQLLTPCTTGNGWLRVLDLGRFALSFFDKFTGQGVRVFLDPERVAAWPEIQKWYLKLAPKKEQIKEVLLAEIREAGADLLGFQPVRIRAPFLGKRHRGMMIVCPLCKEAYPAGDGGICRACQGEAPYEAPSPVQDGGQSFQVPELAAVPVEAAVGRRVLHDMTRIIPGQHKGPQFVKDQVVAAGDLCRLQQMGRQRVYLAEDNDLGPEWVHENEAALAFAKAMAGPGITFLDTPREGKVNLVAAISGLLVVDQERLTTFNLLPGVMCASRHGWSTVAENRVVAGTRAIPLFLHREAFQNAMQLLEDGPLFQVIPTRALDVGILVTGTEVFLGMVEDRFVPIIQNKVESYGCRVVKSMVVPDDREAIRRGVEELLAAGARLLVTTAGLSVDPDDVTRMGLEDAGATELRYGAPILPGAMTLLARIGAVPVIGVPACALYFKRTSFDLLLPRLLAGIDVTRRDLARMANGALCLECQTCSFPKCPFGK
jgi:formylmethanofuran dehydrogenase subunit E